MQIYPPTKRNNPRTVFQQLSDFIVRKNGSTKGPAQGAHTAGGYAILERVRVHCSVLRRVIVRATNRPTGQRRQAPTRCHDLTNHLRIQPSCTPTPVVLLPLSHHRPNSADPPILLFRGCRWNRSNASGNVFTGFCLVRRI